MLVILAGSAGCASADDLAMAASVPAVNATNLTGVIKSVSWADPAKGTESEIVVIDAQRKITYIVVTSTTTLWDKENKAILPDKIISRKKVSVNYFTTPEGLNIGRSIKILK